MGKCLQCGGDTHKGQCLEFGCPPTTKAKNRAVKKQPKNDPELHELASVWKDDKK